LSEKYQLDENIRVTKLLLPMVWNHFAIFFIATCALSTYTILHPNPDLESYAIFLEVFQWLPLYSVTMPLVLLWRFKMIRQSMKSALFRMGLNQVYPIAAGAEDRTHEHHHQHFETLVQMWK
jgi:hypothetical protein